MVDHFESPRVTRISGVPPLHSTIWDPFGEHLHVASKDSSSRAHNTTSFDVLMMCDIQLLLLAKALRAHPDVQFALGLYEKDSTTIERSDGLASIQLIDEHTTDHVVVTSHASTDGKDPRIDGYVVVGTLKTLLEE